MNDGCSRDLDAHSVWLPRLDELDVLALRVASVPVHGRLPARSAAPTSVKVTETRMHSSRMCTARGSSRPRGVCLSACWDTHTPLGVGLETPLKCGPGDTPQVWAWRPPWVWAWRPPWVWAWRSPWPDPSASPWVWAWRPPGYLQGMLGYHLQCMLGYHPPVDRQTRVKT